jgi:hypothetical protein
MTTTFTHSVLKDRLDEATKELTKLMKKANRYGNDPIYFTVGQEHEEDYPFNSTDLNGNRCVRYRKVTMVELEIVGNAPTVGNFEFLAHMEHGSGGNIIDQSPFATVQVDHKYRSTEGYCDHCKINRARKDLYIVLDKNTGEQRQVGRTCLRDYLGMDNPQWIAARFAMFAAVRGMGYSDFVWGETVERLLFWVSVSTKLFGWVSKGKAWDNNMRPTVDDYWMATHDRPDARMNDSAIRWDKLHAEADQHADEHKEAAEKAAEWITTITDDEKNDYLFKLRALRGGGVIFDRKHAGMTASGLSAYYRAMEKEEKLRVLKANNKDSQFLGAVKVRLKGLAAVIEKNEVIRTNDWGENVKLVKFRTDDGNLISWFTSSYVSQSVGEKCVLDGTVKAHKEWNGIKETQMTRVKVHG